VAACAAGFENENHVEEESAMISNDPVVQALREGLGNDAVSTDPDVLRAHGKDAWPLAAKWNYTEAGEHLPACVVMPADASGVIQCVQIATGHGRAMVPYGAGSGVTGAAVPPASAVVVDLRALNELVALDEDNFMVTTGPGMIGGHLEHWLGERGYTLGHYPQSLHLASMGGLVSTRSTGTFSSKYGGIEDLLLGLEAVLPDGELITLRPTPRSAAGPNLAQLFVGAEGAFGLITQVTVRIYRKAERLALGGYAFDHLSSAVAAVREAYGRHVPAAVLRLYDSIEAEGLYKRVGENLGKPLLITGHEGVSEIAEAEQKVFAEIAVGHGATPLGEAIGKAWEAHRFDASWLTQGNDGPTRMADAIEVAVSWSGLVPLYDDLMKTVAPQCSKAMGHYSHFYTTGACLYFIFFVEGEDTQEVRTRYTQIWDTVMTRVLAAGGTIGHHHGVGLARAARLPDELGSGHILLSRLKHALDARNLMNPGKFGIAAAADQIQRAS
jgi:alkyldihydroxyacetonephosphate synthase